MSSATTDDSTTTSTSSTGQIVAVESSIVAVAKEPNFFFSVDDREFDATELFESINLIITNSDGSTEAIDIINDVDFNGLTPEAKFTDAATNIADGTYTGVYMGYVSPYYNGEIIEDAQSLIYIGVKGDATLDGTVGLDDASAILAYYADSAVGLDASLTGTTGDYETLAYFLADVDTESTAGANTANNALNLDDASAILAYYSQNAVALDPQWDVIIPSLKELEGSLWYERANA